MYSATTDNKANTERRCRDGKRNKSPPQWLCYADKLHPERFLSIETQKKRLYCSWQKWEHSSICSILSLNVASLHAVSKRNTRSHKIHCSYLTSYLKFISFGGFLFLFFLNIQENQTLCLTFQNRHSFNIWIRTFSFPKQYIFFQKNTSKLDKRMCCGPL